MVSPVPADIDIANSVEPFHISEIAKELNLSPNHYDLYGKYKAKVITFLSSFFFCFFSIPSLTSCVYSQPSFLYHLMLFFFCCCHLFNYFDCYGFFL